MNSQTISRELALRIGLAARALPDTDAKRLLTVLTDCIGLPINEQKLAGLDIDMLKTAKGGEFSDVDAPLLTHALNLLKTGLDLPKQQAYADGDMPGSIRIACGSNDGINVDGHFGSCTQFMIYQVAADEVRLIDIRDTAIPDGLEVHDKNVYRAELIQDCQVLYVSSVGGPAAAKIVKSGIHPIKLPSVDPINEIIGRLQQVIAGTPPPWLAKAMGIDAAERFKFGREATG